MMDQTKSVGSALALAMIAGLAASSASGGVEEIVWVEVDNSVGTMGDAAGAPTGLNGVRTFDLYALVSPDTKVWAADFGYVGKHRGFDDNMWTTQSVYQHAMGGDVQSNGIGVDASLASLEFDTYVGLGMLDSKVVMNTAILGGNWSPSMFEVAWYGSHYSADWWVPAVGDAGGKLFLARISVSSSGEHGDMTGESEFLGGMVFLSGEDDSGEFGQYDSASGLFAAPNAFPVEHAAVIAASNGNGGGASSGGDVEEEPPAEALPTGDINGDGMINGVDLSLMQQVFGSTNDPQADLNGDGIVSDLDMQILLRRIEWTAGRGAQPSIPGADHWAQLTPKERKKLEKQQRQAEKRRQKEERKAAKKADKERKRLEKQRRKEEKKREKERKKREKQGK